MLQNVWRLPQPAKVGSVDPEAIHALSDALPTGTVYTYCLPTEPEALLAGLSVWEAAQEPMSVLAKAAIEAASEVMTLQRIGFTLLKETMAPYSFGKNPSSWHAGDKPALLLATEPTTEFPVGTLTVPKGRKIKELIHSAALVIPEEPELERDGVEVYSPEPGDFTLLTETAVHRAPKNRSDIPLTRVHIKFDVIQRQRLLAARYSRLRRVA